MLKAVLIRELATVSAAGPTSQERNDSDALLVARIRSGDEEAFEALMERYQGPIFRYLRAMIGGDTEQARDLLQETFLRAYKSLDSLADPGLLRSWLYRIAHNQACSFLRRRRLISWLPLRLHDPSPRPPPDRTAIDAAQIEEALAHLPVEQRAPLILHLVAGFSYSEISALLQISEGATRMRISRGRAAFRAAYGAEENDNAS